MEPAEKEVEICEQPVSKAQGELRVQAHNNIGLAPDARNFSTVLVHGCKRTDLHVAIVYGSNIRRLADDEKHDSHHNIPIPEQERGEADDRDIPV